MTPKEKLKRITTSANCLQGDEPQTLAIKSCCKLLEQAFETFEKYGIEGEAWYSALCHGYAEALKAIGGLHDVSKMSKEDLTTLVATVDTAWEKKQCNKEN